MHGPYDDPNFFGDLPKPEEVKRKEKEWKKIEAKEKEKAERKELKRLKNKYE